MSNFEDFMIDEAVKKDAELRKLTEARIALRLLLDNIDYDAGNCRVNELIGAVLPIEILRRAKKAIEP